MLQAAAVIGKEVSLPLLQAITTQPEEGLHQSLRHLQAAEFLYELRLFPDCVYTFKHALTQEVAYRSLLQRTRQQYHLQIAHALAEQFPGTAATQPELLAHHYTEAGLGEQAIPYWQRAGQRAIERSANHEAISHLTRGLEVLRSLPVTSERIQQELTLQLALGTPLLMLRGHTAPEVEHAYTRALELCQQVGDSPQRFSALVGLWRFYLSQARLQTTHELAEQCFTLAQRMQDPVLLQEGYQILGSTLAQMGELLPARTYLEQGIALYDPQQRRSRAFSSVTDPGVLCLCVLARPLWLLGYPDQALRRSQEAVALAQRLSHAYSLGNALFFAATIHDFRREVQYVQEQAEAMITLSHEHGFVRWLGVGIILRGWALVEQGSIEEGIGQMRQGLATWQAMRGELGLSHLLARLAEAYGKAGQIEEGLHVLAEVLAIVHKNMDRHYQAELYRLKGELLLQEGKTHKLPEAEESLRQALDMARQQSAKSLELRVVMSLSRLWQMQGKGEEARRMLMNIYGWFTEGFDTRDLQEAKALLAALQ